MLSTTVFTLLVSLVLPQQQASDKVFSGPQVGEKLPALEVIKFGDKDGKKIDFIKQADGKPVVVIFMHQLTRPAAGAIRAITNYCAKREKDGLRSCVIFLTDDPTAGEKRMKRAKRAIVPSEKTLFGISHLGIEGPGSYGLNRSMTLTVLVGKDSKVTANFALKQPSLQVDVPKIAKAIVKLVGGKEPTLKELRGNRKRNKRKKRRKGSTRKRDPNIARFLRPVISKDAGPKRIREAAKELEDYAAKHPRFKAEIGNIVRRIQKAGTLERYGNKTAQEFLKKWGKEWKSPKRKQSKRKQSERNKKKENASFER